MDSHISARFYPSDLQKRKREKYSIYANKSKKALALHALFSYTRLKMKRYMHISCFARTTAIIALLFLTNFAIADTVTTIDGVSYNGIASSLDEEYLQFTAKYEDKSDSFSIPRSKIRGLEFNRSTFNLHPPRGPFLVHEPPKKASTSPSTSENVDDKQTAGQEDIVYLRGGDTKKGHIQSFDGKVLILLGLPAAIPKHRLHSIAFAASQ
jgi:hypothetical protein